MAHLSIHLLITLNQFQTKFSSAVGNRRLAPRINGSLHSTNQEVNSIRLELDVTNKKLKEISIIKDVCARCQGKKIN